MESKSMLFRKAIQKTGKPPVEDKVAEMGKSLAQVIEREDEARSVALLIELSKKEAA